MSLASQPVNLNFSAAVLAIVPGSPMKQAHHPLRIGPWKLRLLAQNVLVKPVALLDRDAPARPGDVAIIQGCLFFPYTLGACGRHSARV